MVKFWDSLDLIPGSYDLVMILCLRDLYLRSKGLYKGLRVLRYPIVPKVTHTKP